MSKKPPKIEFHSNHNPKGQIGYRSASLPSYEGVSYSSASGSEHQDRNRSDTQKEARDHGRNNGLFKGPRERALEYAIASGYKLIMLSKDENFNKEMEARFKEYWKNPDARGCSGMQTEYTWLREHYTVGDVGGIKLDNGKIQIVEAEQIVKPRGTRATDGIGKTRYGMPIYFWVAPYSKGYVRPGRAKKIPANEFLFGTDPMRPSSLRTYPPLQDAFPMLRRIKDIIDSEAIAAQVLSRVAFILNSDRAPDFGKETSKTDPGKSSTDMEDDLARHLVELDYALVFFGNKGDKIEGVERNIPGKDFSENIRMFLRLYGMSWGLPLEITIMDWTQSNFSQMKGAVGLTNRVMIKKQHFQTNTLLDPVLDWKIRSWTTPKSRPEDWQRHDWIIPSELTFEPEKEIQAWGIKLDRGLTTLSIAMKAQGHDKDDLIAARVKDVDEAIIEAEKLYTKHEDFLVKTNQTVSWRPFAGMKDTPEKGRPAGAAPAAGATAEPDDPDKKENTDE